MLLPRFRHAATDKPCPDVLPPARHLPRTLTLDARVMKSTMDATPLARATPHKEIPDPARDTERNENVDPSAVHAATETLLPQRKVERRLTLLPEWKARITEVEHPSWSLPRNDTPLPSLTTDRTLRQEATDPAPKTERLPPRRVRVRRDRDEPSASALQMLVDPPPITLEDPLRETPLPSRAADLKLRVLPELR